MSKSSITGLNIKRVEEKSGPLGWKTVEDEMLRMELSGGTVYLRKSAVEEAGGSWDQLKSLLGTQALEQEIPFTDET